MHHSSGASRLVHWRGIAVFLALSFMAACTSVPPPSEYTKVQSWALEDTGDTRLAQRIAETFPEPMSRSGFVPLADGMDAFAARMAVIDAAERSLDVQYYIWHADTSGILLVDALLQAADRGVRVRLLLDDLDTEGKDKFLAQMDVHPNIEVRLFNPFGYRGSRGLGFLSDLDRLNHRMHNKSLTADNQVTVVGGRNIGNEYFNAAAHTAFADLDVLGIGPVVGKVSSMFDEYWNSDVVVPVSAFADGDILTPEQLRHSFEKFDRRVDQELSSSYVSAILARGTLSKLRFPEMAFHWGNAELVYDDPDKLLYDEVSSDTHLAPKLLPMLRNAHRELLVVSPYFVPGDKLVDFFSELAGRGIQVRILTNSLAANDVGLVHAGYMRYREDLLRGGVELYEFKPQHSLLGENKQWFGSSGASLHAKTLGTDGEHLFVGSFNLDPRSVALNTEMGLIINCDELAQMMHDRFESVAREQAYRVELEDGELSWTEYAADGTRKHYDSEPETSWWQRFTTATLSLIVPESML